MDGAAVVLSLEALLQYVPHCSWTDDSGREREEGDPPARLVDLAAAFVEALMGEGRAEELLRHQREYESLTDDQSPLRAAEKAYDEVYHRVVQESGTQPTLSMIRRQQLEEILPSRRLQPELAQWRAIHCWSFTDGEELRWDLLLEKRTDPNVIGYPSSRDQPCGEWAKEEAIERHGYDQSRRAVESELQMIQRKEEEEHIWGCFLLSQCKSIRKISPASHRQLIGRISIDLARKSRAMQDAAWHLTPATLRSGAPAGPDAVEEITIRIEGSTYALAASTGKQISIQADLAALFGLFVQGVSSHAPNDIVRWLELNTVVGKAVGPEREVHERKASDVLRTKKSGLQKQLQKLGATPDGANFICVAKGKGYHLNHAIRWSFDGPGLKRSTQSVSGRVTDPRKMERNTPDKYHKLPAQSRHSVTRDAENDDKGDE